MPYDSHGMPPKNRRTEDSGRSARMSVPSKAACKRNSASDKQEVDDHTTNHSLYTPLLDELFAKGEGLERHPLEITRVHGSPLPACTFLYVLAHPVVFLFLPRFPYPSRGREV